MSVVQVLFQRNRHPYKGGLMAICYLCQSETQLHDNGTPICLTCSEKWFSKGESTTNQAGSVHDAEAGEFKPGKLYRTANE